ncbi:MAG: tRNA epoxyqueuosine(34) reductase QueG [Bacteroidia bacterium]|nr:tRNA epoxyqueuosine(34) reductase QueG [Bacteroidia bacterium]
MDRKKLSFQIKKFGEELGFDMLGISKAEFLEEEASDLEKWLKGNLNGKMQYMENYFDKRLDPRLLVPGAKSVISVIHNYYPKAPNFQKGVPKISRYAWGEDYHKVLKRKLYELFKQIHNWMDAEIPGRVFVDSAPVLDKAWAKRSGLGWIGKHTNLISPQKGSWFFIGEIILDLELEYDGPIKDYCGTCTRCIDACPTEALSPYQIDANKCISYLTIELREETDSEYQDKMEGWMYGCDICQEVCPWNRFSKVHEGEEFSPKGYQTWTAEDWEEIDERAFKKLTKKTAMNRISWEKMKSNLRIWKENIQSP